MGAAWTARRAILLIEDDPDIGEMIAELLRSEGYAVTIATSARAGVAALATGRFDLVLTDAFANGGTGEERWSPIEEIRRAAAPMPTIICTAHRSQEFAGYAERGFAALLEKPFDLDDLLHLTERLINRGDRRTAPPRGDHGGH